MSSPKIGTSDHSTDPRGTDPPPRQHSRRKNKSITKDVTFHSQAAFFFPPKERRRSCIGRVHSTEILEKRKTRHRGPDPKLRNHSKGGLEQVSRARRWTFCQNSSVDPLFLFISFQTHFQRNMDSHPKRLPMIRKQTEIIHVQKASFLFSSLPLAHSFSFLLVSAIPIRRSSTPPPITLDYYFLFFKRNDPLTRERFDRFPSLFTEKKANRFGITEKSLFVRARNGSKEKQVEKGPMTCTLTRFRKSPIWVPMAVALSRIHTKLTTMTRIQSSDTEIRGLPLPYTLAT